MAKKQTETNGSAKTETTHVRDSVTINVPIGSDQGGYIPQHVDLQLTQQEGVTIKRIRSAMCEMNAIKIRGRDPSYADVVRLLLSRVGDKITEIPS